MTALEYIKTNFPYDESSDSPISLPISREIEIPKMFAELGFQKGTEIGIYKGEYSKLLLSQIPNLELFGIDLWELYTGYRDYKKNDLRGAYEVAKENTKTGNCTLIKDWSTRAHKKFKDESLDFVYIDGNHSYEYTVMDLAFWSKKVKKGGVVYGHDFEDWSHNWRRHDMNVINAVTGWCKSYDIKPWFVIQKDKHPSWLYIKS